MSIGRRMGFKFARALQLCRLAPQSRLARHIHVPLVVNNRHLKSTIEPYLEEEPPIADSEKDSYSLEDNPTVVRSYGKYIRESQAIHKIEGAKYLLTSENNYLSLSDYKSILKGLSNVLKSREVIKITLAIYSSLRTSRNKIDEELYNDILLNLLNNYPTIECCKFYYILLETLPEFEYQLLKARLYEIWSEMKGLHFKIKGDTLRSLFVRVSFFSDVKSFIADDLDLFVSMGYEIHSDCYLAGLFQLRRVVSPHCEAFFEKMKLLDKVTPLAYANMISFYIETEKIEASMALFREAMKEYTNHLIIYIDTFKSFLHHTRMVEALYVYDLFMEKFGKRDSLEMETYTLEMTKTALYFLTRKIRNPYCAEFIKRFTNPATNLPRHMSCFSLIVYLHLNDLRKFKDLIERGPDDACAQDSKLVSTILLTYLSSDICLAAKYETIDYCIHRYKMMDAIRHVPMGPLAAIGNEVEGKLGIVLQFAHVHSIALNFSVLYRLVRLLYHRSRYDLIVSIYELYESKLNAVIHSESFQYFVDAFLKLNEWRAIHRCIVYVKREKLRFLSHRFPITNKVFNSHSVIYEAIHDAESPFSDREPAVSVVQRIRKTSTSEEITKEELFKLEILLENLRIKTVGALRRHNLYSIAFLNPRLIQAIHDAITLPKKLSAIFVPSQASDHGIFV